MQSISRTRSPKEQRSPATVYPHFILDQNFPWYVVSFPWPSHIGITRLPEHAPDLVQNVEDWEVLLEPLLPSERDHPQGGRPWTPARQVLDRIFFVLRTGCQWKA